MTPQVQPRTASGLPEYLPAEQIEFNRLLDIIRRIYERYGFAPLDTTILELTDVLLAKEAGETGREVYSFAREGSNNGFTLRFDLTVPLARYVAQYESKLVFPFSRYAIGKVYRAERAQAGRFREFYQCDIDTIGSESPVVDAQFPAIINEIFGAFNFGEFIIRLNDRRLLNGFFEAVGIIKRSTEVLRIIDKMEKIDLPTFVAELTKLGLDTRQVEQVLAFTAISGTNDEVLAQLKGLGITAERFVDGVSKLEQLVGALRAMGVPESRFAIDLKIARGLDYYTGTVYETILVDHPEVGSVCSGGRYDNLAGLYTNTALPGVGISIGLTRLFYVLLKMGIVKPQTQSPAQVVVMPLGDEQLECALVVAATLRNAGIATMLYTEPNKMGKKLQYANRMGFPYAVLIGAKDVAAAVVSLKDMTSGDTVQVAVDELPGRIV